MVALLPKTRKPALLAVLAILVISCVYAGVGLLLFAFQDKSFFPIVFSGLFFWLAAGLWLLKPVAHKLTLVVLCIQLLGTITMPLNPFYYLEFKEKYQRITSFSETSIKYATLASILACCIFILIKYKDEFTTKEYT